MKTKKVLFPIEVPDSIYCCNYDEQMFCRYFNSEYSNCDLEMLLNYDKKNACYLRSFECLCLDEVDKDE